MNSLYNRLSKNNGSFVEKINGCCLETLVDVKVFEMAFLNTQWKHAAFSFANDI